MSKYANPFGKTGFNELSPYVQKLLLAGGDGSGSSSGSSGGNGIKMDYSVNIKEDQWRSEDGVYYVIIAHNLQSTGLIVFASETKTGNSLQEAYTILNDRQIKIYNDEKIDTTVNIIDAVKASKGGVSIPKTASEFLYDPQEELYTTKIFHGLDTYDIAVNVIDSNNKSVYVAYTKLDNNNIRLFSTAAENIFVNVVPLTN